MVPAQEPFECIAHHFSIAILPTNFVEPFQCHDCIGHVDRLFPSLGICSGNSPLSPTFIVVDMDFAISHDLAKQTIKRSVCNFFINATPCNLVCSEQCFRNSTVAVSQVGLIPPPVR